MISSAPPAGNGSALRRAPNAVSPEQASDAGLGFVQRGEFQQIAAVRDDHALAVAARDVDADGARPVAQLLVARRAKTARAAADPGIDDAAVADLHPSRLGTQGNDLAHDLVARNQRQLQAARQIDALAVAEIEKSVGKVDVAMADPAGTGAQRHLGAGQGRHRLVGHSERFAERLDLEAAHLCCFPVFSIAAPAVYPKGRDHGQALANVDRVRASALALTRKD